MIGTLHVGTDFSIFDVHPHYTGRSGRERCWIAGESRGE